MNECTKTCNWLPRKYKELDKLRKPRKVKISFYKPKKKNKKRKKDKGFIRRLLDFFRIRAHIAKSERR